MKSPESPEKPVTEEGSVTTAGRYRIQEELGRGATGVVYKAYDQLIGRTVALKAISLDPNTPDREDLIKRLKQEAKAAGKLDHPNIITIYDVGQEDDVIYLSMQFVEGKTLLTFLAEEGVPTIPTLISWADQISSAVGFAHARGVVHRDLKPANLMLTCQNTIKVLDFGIAQVENETLTQPGLVVGTPSHMAPEQVAGKKIDHRADIFALGSVFYELVTQEKPFRGDVTTILFKIMNEDPVPPSIINPALPAGIDAIIRKALAKDPRERFQTCEEMRAAFVEQAALLKIELAAPFAVAPPVAPTAPQAAAFPHYLLEEVDPPRPSSARRGMALVLGLGLLVTTGWAFYTRPYGFPFRLSVKGLTAAFHRAWPARRVNAVKSDGSVAQQADSIGGPQPLQSFEVSSVSHETRPPLETSDTPSNAGTAQTQLAPEVSSNSSGESQAPAAQSSDSRAARDVGSAPASTPFTPKVGQAQAPESSRASDQPLNSPSLVTLQRTQHDDLAESASNPPVANGNTAVAPKVSGNQETSAAAASVAKPLKRNMAEPALTVDGFTRLDIPELVRRADAAEERGDYRLARHEYSLVLKLDRNNSAARAGLYRIDAMDQSH